MLNLDRWIGERIKIGDDIEVIVLGVTDGKVRLGVVAPHGVEVFREEIYRRIQTERAVPSRAKQATTPTIIVRRSRTSKPPSTR